METEHSNDKVKEQSKGGRNLIILGIGAILLATISTGLSLMLYRTSGDIYLDRSRPGFLPDETEEPDEPMVDPNYSFADSGPLTKAELETYLEELDQLIDELEKYNDVYNPDPLSDESLGIPSELKED